MPREAKTAIAPKPSGTAAATGERKTSRRTIRRIGRAISSARSPPLIDSSWTERKSVAKPLCVARTGEWIDSSIAWFDQRHPVVDRLVEVVVEVGDDQGPAGTGPQLADRADVPGRERGHFRVAAQVADQRRPLAVDRRRLALQQDRERSGIAEVLAQHAVGVVNLGAGDIERAGAELLLEAEAEGDEDGDEDRGDRQRAARVAQHQRRARLALTLSARVIPRPPAPPHRHAV